MAKMSDSDNEKISAAKKKYADAQAKGDKAGMESAHAEAEAVRANYGFSGGADGSQNISLSGSNSNPGDWIGGGIKRENTVNETKSNYGTYEDDLNRFTEAQKKAQTAELKQAKEKALANLDVQEQAIKPMYQNQRNIASASSQQGARNFAEYLANRGLTNSGAAAQGEINRLSTLQNTMGEIGTAEANAYRDIANQRTAIENDYVSNLANANAQLEANYYSNLLNYNQVQREKVEALQQQALGQYADDYQARINELLAQGYSPNSMEILQLQALRGNKQNQFVSNSIDPNVALANIQSGNITYNNAAALGLTVEQAQNYYNELKAQAEAAQQELENYIAMQKLQNETLETQYAINKPYYKPSTGGSSSKSSTTKLSTHLGIIDKYFDPTTKAGKQGILNYLETANKNGDMSDSDAMQAIAIYKLDSNENSGGLGNILSNITSIFK